MQWLFLYPWIGQVHLARSVFSLFSYFLFHPLFFHVHHVFSTFLMSLKDNTITSHTRQHNPELMHQQFHAVTVTLPVKLHIVVIYCPPLSCCLHSLSRGTFNIRFLCRFTLSTSLLWSSTLTTTNHATSIHATLSLWVIELPSVTPTPLPVSSRRNLVGSFRPVSLFLLLVN